MELTQKNDSVMAGARAGRRRRTAFGRTPMSNADVEC
jgi:hypothetical protein